MFARYSVSCLCASIRNLPLKPMASGLPVFFRVFLRPTPSTRPLCVLSAEARRPSPRANCPTRPGGRRRRADRLHLVRQPVDQRDAGRNFKVPDVLDRDVVHMLHETSKRVVVRRDEDPFPPPHRRHNIVDPVRQDPFSGTSATIPPWAGHWDPGAGIADPAPSRRGGPAACRSASCRSLSGTFGAVPRPAWSTRSRVVSLS